MVGYGYALGEEFALTVDERMHFLDFARADGDHRCDGVVVGERLVVVAVGGEILHFGGSDGDFLIGEAVGFEEVDDALVGGRDVGVDCGQGVAYLLEHDGPGDDVGRHFAFGESAHVDRAVARGCEVDSGADAEPEGEESEGEDD